MGSSATTHRPCSITICKPAGQITLKSEQLLLAKLLLAGFWPFSPLNSSYVSLGSDKGRPNSLHPAFSSSAAVAVGAIRESLWAENLIPLAGLTSPRAGSLPQRQIRKTNIQ